MPTPALADQENRPARLTITEKISIVNALMAQDRDEIRNLQAAVFTLSYYVIPGSIGIAVFFLSHSDARLRLPLLVGQGLLALLYLVVFVTLRKWLKDARACLHIRESFYKEQQELLFADTFDPLRSITEDDHKAYLIDGFLWFPVVVTGLVMTVMLTFMLVLWRWH